MSKVFILLASCFLLVSCTDPGTTEIKLKGNESILPKELEGLKIYDVSLGNAEYVKVAIFNDKINSLTYRQGKVSKTTILYDRSENNIIEISNIISENDSIIVAKKVKSE